MRNILIYRTSTDRQESEEQLKETLEYAGSFGARNIVEIGGEGLSAIKLDDQYVKTIEKVFDLIDEGDIECVYAWSIDRIGRNEELLMKFKNRLIAAGVQLRIKNPTLQLLNDDGSVNSGMEIAFSLFATMSKQEMELKKKRFKRTKDRNKREGKYNGGRIKFGYSVDKDGYYYPDPVNGEHVRDIFRMYAETPASISYITKVYVERGVFTTSLKTAEALINRMLKDKGYIGQTFYPRLVDDGTFSLVQEKLKEYRIVPKNRYEQTPYYCYGVLYDLDGYDMHRMRVKKSEVSYMSYTEKFSLSINLLDSMVIQILDMLIKETDFSAFSASIDRRVEELSIRKEKLLQEAEKVAKRGDELDNRYFIMGTVRNYDRLKKDLEFKLIEIKKQIDLVESTRLNLLAEKESERPVDLYTLSDDGRREAVLKYVSRIMARKIDAFQASISIECQTSLGTSATVIYDRKRKAFHFMSLESGWVPIKVIRSISGRNRTPKQNRIPNATSSQVG